MFWPLKFISFSILRNMLITKVALQMVDLSFPQACLHSLNAWIVSEPLTGPPSQSLSSPFLHQIALSLSLSSRNYWSMIDPSKLTHHLRKFQLHIQTQPKLYKKYLKNQQCSHPYFVHLKCLLFLKLKPNLQFLVLMYKLISNFNLTCHTKNVLVFS